MNILLKFGKWYWIIIFIAVAVLEIIKGIQHTHTFRWLYHSHIPLMLLITLLIFHRNWLSWWFMICTCVFGLYNLFTWALIASSPTSMDFSYYLRHGLGNHSYRILVSSLSAPQFFYFFTLILYFTRAVRRKYFQLQN